MVDKDLESIINSMELFEGLSFYLTINNHKPAAIISSLYEESAEDFGLRCKYTDLPSAVIVSYDQSSLKELDRAIRSKDNFKIGVALGYPERASKSFLKDGWDGTRFFMEVEKLFEETGEMPIHLAYLPYVPEPEAVRDESSESSVLGVEYMEFIKERSPSFSRKLEENFEETVENIKYFKD